MTTMDRSHYVLISLGIFADRRDIVAVVGSRDALAAQVAHHRAAGGIAGDETLVSQVWRGSSLVREEEHPPAPSPSSTTA